MSNFSLKECAQVITSSLVWGGPKTFDQLKELDWLEHISGYGISMYLREAEKREWIKVKYAKDKPNVYSATKKGRIMDENRD
jgi:hypothetical protein